MPFFTGISRAIGGGGFGSRRRSRRLRNYTQQTIVYNDQNPVHVPYTNYSPASPAYDGTGANFSGSVFPGDAGTQTGFTAITTFDPPIPVNSTVKLYLVVQNGTNFYVNGNHVGPSIVEFYSFKIVDVTSYVGGPGGTLQSIRWGYNVGYWNALYILPYYVEVDGVRLVDNTDTFG